MNSVSIGGFYKHIIGVFYLRRIFDYGLVYIPHIARENHFLRDTVFTHPCLDARGTQQMAYIGEADLYTLLNLCFFAVFERHKVFHKSGNMLHRIGGLRLFFPRPFGLADVSLGVRHLNIGRVS